MEKTGAHDILMGTFKTLNIDPDHNMRVSIVQSQPVTVDGKHYEASGSSYQSVFNVNAGMIVADNNYSPEYEKPHWPKEAFVPLKQWSGVVFLLWERVAMDDAKDLRHIFRCAVTNPQTLSIMRKAPGEDDNFDYWNKYGPMKRGGRTFRPGSIEYYALLYSPNGRGIGWMLAQHKSQLGLRTVSSITIFGADGEPSLYFKIDPVRQNG
ncbi:hypothetical protein BDV26DRAFT_292222 [Aspergillus bertholletiae]|uniref:Uncharacterized protein n=1 Tax=Aspergillus bertholletiae TaxID=1226010 RepID=A0A5N7B9G8_9EURO|nr:hypothetical protein BDV26DRAFT_292222 [Aspergillus bertholletiae]